MSESTVLGWMFDGNPSDDGVPLPSLDTVETGGRRNRRRVKKKRVRKVSVAAVTCLLLGLAMFVHEWWKKSLSNALVLGMLVIYSVTLLYVAMGQCERRVKSHIAKTLFVMGFGPAFVLLICMTLLLFITILGYYCYGADCQNLDDVPRIKMMPTLLLQSPLRGVMFAFFVSFVNAALLEETIKFVFVSNSIECVPASSKVSEEPPIVLDPHLGKNAADLLLNKDYNVTLDAQDSESGMAIYQPDPTLEIIQADTTKVVTGRQGIVLYFLAFSLGLALAESMLYVCSFARNPNEGMKISLYRMCFSIPMHVTCGCLTALGLVERYIKENVSLFQVLLPSILFHGAFDFFHVVPLSLFVDVPNLDVLKHITSVLVLAAAMLQLRRRFEVHRIVLFSSDKL